MTANTLVIRNEASQAVAIDWIERLNLEGGKEWEVTVKRHREKRTLNQNGLMWKWIDEVVDEVAKHSGHTAEEVHEAFKELFLPPVPDVTIGGVMSAGRKSTKNLKTDEMSTYMNHIHAFCTSELGFLLTLPEERHLG